MPSPSPLSEWIQESVNLPDLSPLSDIEHPLEIGQSTTNYTAGWRCREITNQLDVRKKALKFIFAMALPARQIHGLGGTRVIHSLTDSLTD